MALGLTASAAAACLLAVRLIADGGSENAVLLAALLATCNAIIALGLAQTGARSKSLKGFFSAIFGGMILRMATTLVGFLAGVRVLLLPAVPFAVALMIFTGVFTVAEIALWSRQNFSPRTEFS